MILSERDARGPDPRDAPLEWRAPSKELEETNAILRKWLGV